MKALKVISLVLVLVMFSSLLLACNDTEEPIPSGTEAPTEAPTSKPTSNPINKPTDNPTDNGEPSDETPIFENGLSIDGVDISKFVIVHAEDAPNTATGFASSLQEWIYDVADVELEIVDDTTAEADYEILVGSTNRSESNLTVSSDTLFDFKASVKNNKLAVMAKQRNGWKVALDSIKCSFIKNEGLLEKCELSNNKIAYEDMKSLISGAIRYEVLSDGLRAFRSTEAQMAAWDACTAAEGWPANSANKDCPERAPLICLDFDTNSSFVKLQVSGGGMTVLINDEFIIKDTSSYSNLNLDNGNGTKMNHITVILPTGNSNSWKITELQVSANATIEKHKTDLNILILGDSITEGYNNHGNPHLTYTFTVKQLLNANVLNQGNSGSQIWKDLLDPELADLFQPDVIIIALGTNDYECGQRKDGLKSRMNEYLDKLETIYPDVPVIGLTPIARLNNEMTVFDSALKNSSAGLIEAFEAHGAMAVDAEDFCEHNPAYYADRVHPNELGFPVYGKHICEAIEDKIAEIVAAKNN